jgi:alkylation response protein AidB-like acyl-CoA dehydrogenase
MDFVFTPEQEKLRKEVRDFLAKEAPKEALSSRDDSWTNREASDKEFARKVGKKGWIGMTWPKGYGGGGYTYLDRLIVNEEMLTWGAPVASFWTADRQMGPAILAFGTEEQKRFFIPRIMSGDLSFCIGMSEPEAGSDVAAVKTRAVDHGDHFMVNGQKLWTSGGFLADYCYMYVRTNPDVPKHEGISQLIIDLKLPGITIRTLEDQMGEHGFCEVFLEDVRVPKTALVGEIDRGWNQLAAQLDHERAGLERCMSNRPLFLDFVEFAREHGLFKDIRVRSRIAELETEFEIARQLCYRVAWVLTEGRIPNYESSVAKLFGQLYMQKVATTITEVLGLYGQLMPGSKWAPLNGRPARRYLLSPGYGLMGGSTEVLRNIIAMRGLGLPRK